MTQANRAEENRAQEERDRYLQQILNEPVDPTRNPNTSNMPPAAEVSDFAAAQSDADEAATAVVEDQATAAALTGEVESSDRIIKREQVLVNPETGERITEQQTLVVPSFDRLQEARITRAQRIVYYIATFATIVLVIRFVLRLFGANDQTGFGSFIFALSWPFYLPFNGLFGGDLNADRFVFDGEALFAIAIYWLFAYLIARGVAVFIRRSAVREVVTTADR